MNQPLGEKKQGPLVGSVTQRNRGSVRTYTNASGPTELVGCVKQEDDGQVDSVAITDTRALVEIARILAKQPEESERELQRGNLSFDEEVVVRERDRPSFVVQHGTLKDVNGPWAQQLNAALDAGWLQRAIAAVGRIDDDRGHVGTGCLVLPGVVVTNAHVADEFVRGSSGSYTLKNNPIINFVGGADTVIGFSEVIYVDQSVDLALLKLTRDAAGRVPLEFANEPRPAADTTVAVIGFPAKPSARKLDARQKAKTEKVFGDEYGVKRVAVGKVFIPPVLLEGEWHFAHDASTLGGSSGSLVIDLATGTPLGVHFYGIKPDFSNHAIYSHEVDRLLKEHYIGQETA